MLFLGVINMLVTDFGKSLVKLLLKLMDSLSLSHSETQWRPYLTNEKAVIFSQH